VAGEERVKIIDFGLRNCAGWLPGHNAWNHFGTPALWHPSVQGCREGRSQSDLYALGCILFEMVCGRPPFGLGGLAVIAAQLRIRSTAADVSARLAESLNGSSCCAFWKRTTKEIPVVCGVGARPAC